MSQDSHTENDNEENTKSVFWWIGTGLFVIYTIHFLITGDATFS